MRKYRVVLVPEELITTDPSIVEAGHVAIRQAQDFGIHFGPFKTVGALHEGQVFVNQKELKAAAVSTLDPGKQAWPGGGS